MRFLTLGAALFLVGCGTASTDTGTNGTGTNGTGTNSTAARIANITSLTADATAGGTLYQAQCATCHAADGTGGTGWPLVNITTTADVQIDAIINGRNAMPAYGTLTDQEITNIVEFYSTL